jgi:hypothetical protein
VTVLVTRDPATFADRAGDFLQTRIECNILVTVLSAVRGGTLAGRGELFGCVLDGSGRVQGAALRTPPRPMLASPCDPDAADELIASWLAEDPG